jgi:hypothetical protein
MLQNAIFGLENEPENFFCEICSYACSKQSNLDRHFSTTKHKNAIKMLYNATSKGADGNKLSCGTKTSRKTSKPEIVCNCGKVYIHNSSFYRHRKNCFIYQNENKEEKTTEMNPQGDMKEMILLLLKENKEIQQNFVSLLPHIKGNNTNSNNTITNNTTHNNQFNINVFLNEHCKNAMNLTEFINSLPITNETYDYTIENGLTKTITSMVVDGLNNMDISERPIHCTDPVRKTMYVKDNDVWEKDNELKLLLHGIKELSFKQRTSLCKWQDANNGWDKDENLQTRMTKLVYNSMMNVEDDVKETNKIIRAIGKNTYLSNNIKNNFKI